MQRFILAILMIGCSFGMLLAQNSIPRGMNYQAVARNFDGQLVANQNIALKITLLADPKLNNAVYIEIHDLRTNELGLFNLIIGEGQSTKGNFSEVPWSTEEIWLDIAIDERGGSDFTSISTTRLLAVPYAFHAGSADRITGSEAQEANTNNKITGPYWKSNGNAGVFAPHQFLGTLDNNPLVIKSNNQERMRITPTGEVTMSKNNIKNLANPVDLQDAATKAYVDGAISSGQIDWNNITGIPADIADGDQVDDADADPTNELQNWSNLPGIPANIDIDATDDFSGSYNDLTDVPTDQVSDADADPTNELQDWSNLPGIPANIDIDATDDFSGSYNDLTDVPTDQVDDADSDPTNELELPTNPQTGTMAVFKAGSWKVLTPGSSGQVLIIKDNGMPAWSNLPDLNKLLTVELPNGTSLYVNPANSAVSSRWGPVGVDLPGVTNGNINDFNGESNTTAIINQLGMMSSAAKVCADLVEFGFDDWYLPSHGELNTMYKQLGPTNNGFGGSGDIVNNGFWSSTENNGSPMYTAGVIIFDPIDYDFKEDIKDGYYSVRCVRK